MKTVLAIFLVLSFATACAGQAAPPAPAEAPAANAADVKTVDSILAALYDVISGPSGQKRDWNRFRSLFVSGARLIPTSARKEGGYIARVLSPEDYIRLTEPYFAKEAFYEKEVARHTEQWAHIAQVFSTYESRHAPGEPPFLRGINSIQLMNDGQRWWVVSVFWEPETKEDTLPDEMLHSPRK